MTQHPSPIDPQNIWRSQKSEATIMSIEELQDKILKSQSKRRREVRFNVVVSGITAATFIAVSVRYVHEVFPLIGWLLAIGASLYILGFTLYENLREQRAERFDTSFGMINSLHFYRRLLEQKRHRARYMALAAVPLVIGAVMNTIPAIVLTIQYPAGNIWVSLVPFFVILVVWLLLFAMIRRRFDREMRGELEMVEAMERELRSPM